MNSIFIRFLENKNHLINDIKEGFVLRGQPIQFKPSIYKILPSLISFWKNKNIKSSHIQPILDSYYKLSEVEFWDWLVREMKENPTFNMNLGMMTNQINSATIKMKCFTELRDNQKLHLNHRIFFGNYGISLTKEWIKKNNGDRIIYVDTCSEITNRIAKLMSMLSSIFNGKDVINAIFDILSFTEIEENSHEYEWRIVGNHHFAGKSYGNYPDNISFTNDDIKGIYVKQQSDIKEFINILEEKRKIEGSASIPQVFLTDDIFLTMDEIKEIENIHKRHRKK